jgi:pimeloyl-ACP methyl ester carboxylesterase
MPKATITSRPRVLLLPGGVLPAGPAYQALLARLGDAVDAVTKDLEVYAEDRAPADYTLETEVAGILKRADLSGFDRFHLVGYSGGGAASLAFTAAHPDRVTSLALLEPAWAGNEHLAPEELEVRRLFRSLAERPASEFMEGFTRYQLRPGVAMPPPLAGPAPDWMSKRPAGLAAFLKAFDAASLDMEALRRYRRPVYFALGGLSNPDYYGRMAERLARVFADFTLEVYADRHHFDPPHRIEPTRVAESLQRHWARANSLPRG